MWGRPSTTATGEVRKEIVPSLFCKMGALLTPIDTPGPLLRRRSVQLRAGARHSCYRYIAPFRAMRRARLLLRCDLRIARACVNEPPARLTARPIPMRCVLRPKFLRGHFFRKLLMMFLAATAASACQPSGDVASADLRVAGAIAAYVNGEPIFVSDVIFEAESQERIERGARLQPNDEVFQSVLQDLIDYKVLAGEALTRQLDQSEGARFRLQSARDKILSNLLIEDVVADQVTETAIRRMFDEQMSLLQLGSEARLRHILVETEQQANQIKAQLDGGADFAQLAFERSLDEATRAEGGDLGYVSLDALMPAMSRTAQATEIGQISAPFQSQLGWHILKVEDRRAEAPPTLDEMRPQIVRHMTLDEISRLTERIRQSATIEVLAQSPAP